MFNLLLISNLDHDLLMIYIDWTWQDCSWKVALSAVLPGHRTELKYRLSHRTPQICQKYTNLQPIENLSFVGLYTTLYSLYFQKLAENFWDTFRWTKKTVTKFQPKILDVRWQNWGMIRSVNCNLCNHIPGNSPPMTAWLQFREVLPRAKAPIALQIRCLYWGQGMSLESEKGWKYIRSPVHRASCVVSPCLDDDNIQYLKVHTHYRWFYFFSFAVWDCCQ